MAKNKQLSFPLEPKTYLSPYEDAYDEKLQTLHFGENGQRINEVEEELRAAADVISNCFSWEDTVEGMNFWAHACDALYSMSDELARRQDPNGERGVVMSAPPPPQMPMPPQGYVPPDLPALDFNVLDDDYEE